MKTLSLTLILLFSALPANAQDEGGEPPDGEAAYWDRTPPPRESLPADLQLIIPPPLKPEDKVTPREFGERFKGGLALPSPKQVLLAQWELIEDLSDNTPRTRTNVLQVVVFLGDLTASDDAAICRLEERARQHRWIETVYYFTAIRAFRPDVGRSDSFPCLDRVEAGLDFTNQVALDLAVDRVPAAVLRWNGSRKNVPLDKAALELDAFIGYIRQ